ncbi:MAG: hypothetical protein COB84_01920 [Rhodobacteraceae bacterium]|nr:MAG: hypothetical protein COB84_01920 [Paracoccaceae bacterium]
MKGNHFDQLGATPEYSDEMKAQFDKRDELIHRVFEQSEAGRDLLIMWQDALIMTPTAQPGDDLLTVGLNEGKKSFIRNIITTIRKVET